MVLGGVLLFAGMHLAIAADDHLNGRGRLNLLLDHVVEVQGDEWVVLQGQERPSTAASWRSCRVTVRISALKRSLVFTG